MRNKRIENKKPTATAAPTPKREQQHQQQQKQQQNNNNKKITNILRFTSNNNLKMYERRESLMFEDSNSEGSTRNSSRNSSIFDEVVAMSGEFVSNNSNNNNNMSDINLAATITSIRTNVTRVINMYFRNVTSEVDGQQQQYDTQQHQQHLPQQQQQQHFDFATNATAATTTAMTAASQPTTMPQRMMNAINFVVKTLEAASNTTTTTTTESPTLFPPTNELTTTTTSLLDGALITEAGTTTAASTAASSPSSSFNISTAFPVILSFPPPSSSSSPFTASPPPLSLPPVITYPSFRAAIRSFDNCSALFANYTKPQQGLFCNWTWDSFLCWPPTPAGALARMRCPAGLHGIDTRKFAARNCESDGRWSGRPNDAYNPVGWTNYTQCYKPEVTSLLQQIKDQDVIYAIAVRTRTMEIVGLVLSLCALILSLIIFFNFRTLRNNRTKIHKNLFVAMVIQVIIRLTLYLDQAITRGNEQTPSNASVHGIDNTPYLCEASYVLLEYARTAMFMWMFIEGLYLHNVVTVFQGRFPHAVYTVIGWGVPVLMTAVWAVVTANEMEYSENEPCWWNYNLTIYYWILEGPRLLVVMLNFIFLLNIIRVLVVKLRQSQASDVEQARKAVRAAVVLLPLLGVTNLLYIMPPLGRPAWVFGVWAYVTYFLSSFQGFFIAMIYCFLNGEVRAALLKSLAVYMSVRGHSDWVPRRASMFSGAYHTAHDTEAHVAIHETKRNDSSPNNNNARVNGRLSSQSTGGIGVGSITTTTNNNKQLRVTTTTATERQRNFAHKNNSNSNCSTNNNNNNRRSIGSGVDSGVVVGDVNSSSSSSWMLSLCFRGQKNKCLMSDKKMPPPIFMTTKSNALA